jgi:hypothetical protein
VCSILLINSVGLRIYLDIGPGGEPPSDFQINDLAGARTTSGTPEVVADAHNTGGRALDMTGSMSLTNGPGSLSAGPLAKPQSDLADLPWILGPAGGPIIAALAATLAYRRFRH